MTTVKYINMTSQEPNIIKVQIYHELIGNHTFQFNHKTHTSDLRLHIQQNSPLYIHDNFHLQQHSQRLPQCNQISQIFKGDVRLQVVFDPYDEHSCRYHEEKVKKILANPTQWLVINSRDFPSKNIEEEKEEYPSIKLEQLFNNPFSSSFLNVSEKKESDLGTVINSSGFNPPPFHRKLQGDLYYLHIKTPEETDFHMTATAQGFFVNQSNQGNFNPNPHHKYSVCLSLIDLLFQVSPKFKAKFQQLQKTVRVSEFQRFSYQQKVGMSGGTWMTEGRAWKKLNSWNNDNYEHKQKSDLAIVKDWVEIFQYQSTSPGDSVLEKIGKQKMKYRIYQEFIENVKECVLKIFSGTIQPLNNANKMQQQIYYYSGLLFYFVKDEEHSESNLPSGYAASKQILMLGLVEQIDIDNVYLARLAVINYRGYKIVAKTIPNFLINTRRNFNSLSDILSQCGQTHNDDAMLSALRKISKCLGVQSQNILVDKTDQKMICVNPELLTCTSNDHKRFILETTSFAPKDLNFHNCLSEECFLRPELMKIYNNRQKCSILYNPNVGTSHQLANIEKYKQQQKKMESVAKFAKEIMVSSLLDSFDGDMRKHLSDSQGVVFTLHKFGLSSKYLGLICKKASEKRASHIGIIIERTILVRTLKTFFKRALRQSPTFLHKNVLKHLLNCLFGSEKQNGVVYRQSKYDEEVEWNNGKKGKKKKSKQNQTCFEVNFGKLQDKYCHIKKEDFWEELKIIALNKFKHSLQQKSKYFEFQFSKVAILRDLCLCLGIVIQKKDYFAEGKTNFVPENILNIIPKVKVAMSEPKELNEWIEEGDKQSNKFQIEEAFDAYNKAVQYIFTSFGQMHEKLGTIYKKFSHLHFKIGDVDSALLFAINSHEICENILGFDHVETIQALMMIGIYHFARKKFDSAQYYLLKAIFIAKFAYSECYPEVMVMQMNLSTIYQAQKKFTDAIMSLFIALNISIKVYGQKHLNTAIVYSALASLHYDIPDIGQTIKYQQKAISVLEDQLGTEDERVVEAKSICEGYKNLQNSKKIREVHEKQQRNPLGFPPLGKFNIKAPFYDMQRPNDFVWKKPKKLKYFL